MSCLECQLGRTPWDVEVWIELGVLYMEDLQYRHSLWALQRAAQLDPFNALAVGLQTGPLEGLGRSGAAYEADLLARKLDALRKEPQFN
jgi:hypothetical protein